MNSNPADFTPARLAVASSPGQCFAMVAMLFVAGCVSRREVSPPAPAQESSPPGLDLRAPMALAAQAVARRLDPTQAYRPWFMLRGQGGIPTTPEHASWDLGDMTGRYLEGLVLARQMGVTGPELSEAEGRLGRYLLSLLGPDGLVHDPANGAVDHSFSQGSALYGLVAWFEDSGDPAVRVAAERLISGLRQRLESQGDQLVDPSVKLERSCGSHLAGYAIHPIIRFYELTGYEDAMTVAEGLTRWALADPVLGADGAITLPLSWEGHIHSWLDTLAGCVRTARHSKTLDRAWVVGRARSVYDWVRRTNATAFGWIATFPTHGSSETCAISSAIRLALELSACGHPAYLNDVERFVRNQVIEAQFRDLRAYATGPQTPTPLLVGCFDSQSLPNGHLGTRGGDDVGTVEGCCLNGGMRALALAWQASQIADESGVTINLALTRDGPAARVIGYAPVDGRVVVIPQAPGAVRVRVPDWVDPHRITVSVDGAPAKWSFGGGFVVLDFVQAEGHVSLRYPLRELDEPVAAGGQTYRVRWRGDTVVAVSPRGEREPAYQDRLGRSPRRWTTAPMLPVPDTYALQDAARLGTSSMLARLDLENGGQPFFRIYPFAQPPYAEHQKWDDGDMSGRYVEALILARRMTGLAIDPREALLRQYLAGLFDPQDGLCYTRGAAWTPRRACFFSQSTAMLGVLAWYRETGSPQARRLLDRHADGLMRVAVDHGDHVRFPRYEYDGRQYVDEPKGQEAPPWYGGRTILPLVEYWQLSGRADVQRFLERQIHYVTKVSSFIGPGGEVETGEGWWGHLHSTMDMAAGVCEFGRLTGRRELVEWARRLYDWVGRTHTTRYGWVADVSGGHICESCAIAARIRLGLALHRAGALEPFGEIDRHVRNQLLESQFVHLSFLATMDPSRPRTAQTAYAGIDRMIRGTFQCWGTANDLIGHDDIEGCGAGGGVQGLALAWQSQAEWHDTPAGDELRLHLLFNRRVRGRATPTLEAGVPVALELWSRLPYEGRVTAVAHQPIARLALRLPDGAGTPAEWSLTPQRQTDRVPAAVWKAARTEGSYVILERVEPGDRVELRFPLREYETVETAHQAEYRVRWRGSAVIALEPRGAKVPLYADRVRSLSLGRPAPTSAPRYP